MEKVIFLPVRDEGDFPEDYMDENKFISMVHYIRLVKKEIPALSGSEALKENLIKMEEKSDNELFDHVNREGVGFWRLRPSFYLALIEELRRRKLVPDDCLS